MVSSADSPRIAAPDRQSRELLEFALGRNAIAGLKPIGWDTVGGSVFVPSWRETAAHHQQWLSRFTADGIPVGKIPFIGLGSMLVGAGEEHVGSDERIRRAVHLLGVGISVALLDRGWQIQTRPGAPLVLTTMPSVWIPSPRSARWPTAP